MALGAGPGGRFGAVGRRARVWAGAWLGRALGARSGRAVVWWSGAGLGDAGSVDRDDGARDATGPVRGEEQVTAGWSAPVSAILSGVRILRSSAPPDATSSDHPSRQGGAELRLREPARPCRRGQCGRSGEANRVGNFASGVAFCDGPITASDRRGGRIDTTRLFNAARISPWRAIPMVAEPARPDERAYRDRSSPAGPARDRGREPGAAVPRASGASRGTGKLRSHRRCRPGPRQRAERRDGGPWLRSDRRCAIPAAIRRDAAADGGCAAHV